MYWEKMEPGEDTWSFEKLSSEGGEEREQEPGRKEFPVYFLIQYL